MSRYTKEQCEDVALILSTPIELRIGRLHAETYSSTVGQLAKDFADLFAADNPLFDRDRFLSACGLDYEGSE